MHLVNTNNLTLANVNQKTCEHKDPDIYESYVCAKPAQDTLAPILSINCAYNSWLFLTKEHADQRHATRIAERTHHVLMLDRSIAGHRKRVRVFEDCQHIELYETTLLDHANIS